MLIVSKFRDYYDTSMGLTGVDKSCVYNRTPYVETNKYEINKIFESFNIGVSTWTKGPYCTSIYGNTDLDIPKLIRPFIIGFCGKLYFGYFLDWIDSNDKKEIVFSYEDFLTYVPTNMRKSKHYYYSPDKNIELYFNSFNGVKNSELFVKYNTPIFVLDWNTMLSDNLFDKGYSNKRENLIINPCLKNYNFFKIKSSPQAFQEIQMYLQGVLGNKEKEPIQISEKDKLIQHGMDRWSFRNPDPPKRKQKIN